TMPDYRIAPLHNDRSILAERLQANCARTSSELPAQLARARERSCLSREEDYLHQSKQFFDFSRLTPIELLVLERQCGGRASTISGYDACL
ncbi:hypothetical protein ACMYL4_24125, partial [Salmonella enterica subsp. enterica serovar Typhimurium]|uniref:hypothetical protein n=1 Tax=Salmonella enterica TaxID=28901 RepID=UPI0039E88B71